MPPLPHHSLGSMSVRKQAPAGLERVNRGLPPLHDFVGGNPDPVAA